MTELSYEEATAEDELPYEEAAKAQPTSTLDARQRDLAIRTIYGEAANEPDEGQAAVAAVIRNRMKAGRYGGNDVQGVVLAKGQFEPWARPDARQRMLALQPEDANYKRIAAQVDRVFADEGIDPTGGATHFFAPRAQSALGRRAPSWAKEPLASIGGHTFYAPEGRVGATQASTSVAQAAPAAPAAPAQSSNELSYEDAARSFEGQSAPTPQEGVAQAAPTGGEGEISYEEAAQRTATGSAGAPVPAQEGEAPLKITVRPTAPDATSGPGAFTRGLVGGTIEQNPRMLGEALESISFGAPESARASLQALSKSLIDLSKESPERYRAKAKSLKEVWESGSLDDALTWLGEGVGQGIASTGPVIGLGLGGAAIGSAAGPAGAIVGGVVGATSVSYLLGLGEVHSALKEAGLKPEVAWQYAKWAAPIIAGLDFGGVAGTVARLGGLTKARRELARGVARRVVEEIAKGTAAEGLTEAAQEVVKNATVSLASGKPFWTEDNLWATGESAILGGVTGGAMRGPTGLMRDKTSRVPTAEEVRVAGEELETRPVASEAAEPAKPTFYSVLRKAAEEKLPAYGSVDQVLATLRNQPGVREEELEATGLAGFLANSGGRVSQADVVAYLEENAVEVEETVYGGEGNPVPQYGEYVLPGPQSGYRNLLLHLPGEQTTEFRSSHWQTPNVLAHVRFTDRTDSSGTQVLFLEEVQSDWHQRGRKSGYRNISRVGQLEPQALLIETKLARYVNERLGGQLTTASPEVIGGAKIEGYITEEEQNLYNEYLVERTRANRGVVPDAPFKTSWPDLAFKRMLRWAADNGYSRIAWTTGQQQIERFGHTPERRRGMQEFYDKILPSIARKWGKRLGGRVGMTQVPTQLMARYEPDVLLTGDARNPDGRTPFAIFDNVTGEIFEDTSYSSQGEMQEKIAEIQEMTTRDEVVHYLDVPAGAQTAIQQGLPLFSLPADATTEGPALSRPEILRVAEAFKSLLKEFGLQTKVRLFVGDDSNVGRILGDTQRFVDGTYRIRLNAAQHGTVEELYATAAHEFGHVVMFEKFAHLPDGDKQRIRAAYTTYRQETPMSEPVRQLFYRRDNAILNYYDSRDRNGGSLRPLNSLSPEKREYWAGFDEWFAEQVARWATTSEKAVSLVDRTFERLGKVLRDVLEKMYAKLGMRFEAEPVVASWLDSFIESAPPVGDQVYTDLEQRTQQENQRAVDRTAPEVVAAPQQPELQGVRDGMNGTFGGNPPVEVREAMAWADRFNWLYKWGLNVWQLAKHNPHIIPLQQYREDVQLMHVMEQQWNDAALRISKAWAHLGDGADNLAHLLDDTANMLYLTEEERAQEVIRLPTTEEFARIVSDRKVSAEGVAVFRQIRAIFDTYLLAVEQIAIRDAMKITDPALRQQKMNDVQAGFVEMRKRPYFPFLRFGDHTISVRDEAGVLRQWETVEATRLRSAKRVQHGRIREIEKTVPEGWTVKPGLLSPESQPLRGMPRVVLEQLRDKDLGLSTEQLAVLDELIFDMSPANSFKHRFRKKNFVPGYSKDFKRAFAQYFFRGAKYLAKLQYVDQLRDHMKALRASAETAPDPVKRLEIHRYVQDHLKEVLDPKPDIASLRAAIFSWMFAFFPLGAVQNLTQLPLATFPFLWARFGSPSTIAMMTKATAQWSNYYKRGTLEGMTEPRLRAINEGIKEGVITEAMAPEMAGLSEGNNLKAGYGGAPVEQQLTRLIQFGAKGFELAEQVNRRTTFAAAWDLAMLKPDVAYVEETVRANQGLYQRLAAQQWTESEIRAYIVAKDAVEATQFPYAKWAHPRFMRGHLRTVFVFKLFLQNMLFMTFGHGWPTMWRTLLMMGLLGGAMGLPGADDLKELLKAIAWRLDKRFDIELELRKLILAVAGGAVPPDLILHGASRYGFGVPQAIEYLGAAAGVKDVEMPTFDMSGSIGFGNVLPFEAGKLLGPQRDSSREFAQQSSRAAGAAYGMTYNFIQALNDNAAPSRLERWEKAMPRAIASVSKAYRTYRDEGIKSRDGATLVPFDRRDPVHMAEIFGRAAGFRSLRETATYDRMRMTKEFEEMIDIRKKVLTEQMFEAVMGKNKEEMESVRGAIRRFNQELPAFARGKAISSDGLRQSITSRARERVAKETGVPTQRSRVGISQEMQRLFPEASEVRRVK